jgi:hypothetical protein
VSLIEVIVELDEWWIKQKESDRGASRHFEIGGGALASAKWLTIQLLMMMHITAFLIYASRPIARHTNIFGHTVHPTSFRFPSRQKYLKGHLLDECPNQQVRLISGAQSKKGHSDASNMTAVPRNWDDRGALRSEALYSETSGSEHSLLPQGAAYPDVPSAGHPMVSVGEPENLITHC